MFSLRCSSGWKVLLVAAASLTLVSTAVYGLTLVTTAARELGQPDFVSNAPNTTDSSSAANPTAVAIDQSATPNMLYFVDSNNNRVLAYTCPAGGCTALTSGGAANFVIGQPNFVANTCNSTGRNAASLCVPSAVAVDGSGRVYVADTGNERVLVFDRPTVNGSSAIAVFGQGGDFTSSGCNLNGGPDADSLCMPEGVALDKFNNLYITDFNNNRVLEYNTPFALTSVPGSGDTTADLEFGQGDGSGSDFTDNTLNSGGVSATSIANPQDVATDSKANVYIADSGNNRVLEYNEATTSTSGPANTTANLEFGQGNGSGTDFTQFGCDNNGPLSSQGLCDPMGVTVDSDNNVYIADYFNNRELEFNNAVATSNTTANLVFGQDNDFTANGCDLDGTAASAETLCNPRRSAVDKSNNFYLADYSNNRVLVFNQTTNPPANNTANVELGQPDFVHFHANVPDASGLDFPQNVAVDSQGHLYVSEFNNNRVLGFPNASSFPNGEAATLVIGQPDFSSNTGNNGGLSASSLFEPTGVAVDSSNNLYVSDYGNHRVLIYFTPFTTTGVVGSGDSIADLVIGQGGDFTANGCNLFGAPAASTLCNPDGLTIDPLGNLWVADSANNRVLEYYSPLFNSEANFELGQVDFLHNAANQSGSPGASTLWNPTSVRADSNNNIYVADFNNNRVLEYNNPLATNNQTANHVWGQLDSFTTGFGNTGGLNANSLFEPNDIALDGNNNLYIADYGNSRVLEFTEATNPPANTTANRVFGQADDFTSNSCNFGGIAPSAASACNPTGVAVDTMGNLYVADRSNNRVLQYDPPNFSPSVLTFKGVAVKDSATKTTYLVNNQGVWLNQIEIGISGDSEFKIKKNSCSRNLAPEAKCKVEVTFRRHSAGSKEATLSAADDATNTPQKVSLGSKQPE
jgi:sugar lactone lactonase YvrE